MTKYETIKGRHDSLKSLQQQQLAMRTTLLHM